MTESQCKRVRHVAHEGQANFRDLAGYQISFALQGLGLDEQEIDRLQDKLLE